MAFRLTGNALIAASQRAAETPLSVATTLRASAKPAARVRATEVADNFAKARRKSMLLEALILLALLVGIPVLVGHCILGDEDEI